VSVTSKALKQSCQSCDLFVGACATPYGDRAGRLSTRKMPEWWFGGIYVGERERIFRNDVADIYGTARTSDESIRLNRCAVNSAELGPSHRAVERPLHDDGNISKHCIFCLDWNHVRD